MNQSKLVANTCDRAKRGKTRTSRDWFEFYYWLVEKVARDFLINQRAK